MEGQNSWVIHPDHKIIPKERHILNTKGNLIVKNRSLDLQILAEICEDHFNATNRLIDRIYEKNLELRK